jgi:KDO2-lipid IV(A) lauroyltransferase
VKLLIRIWIAFLYTFSLLPLWVLHRFSDFSYLVVYYGWGYRKKVVRENLALSFPEKTADERLKIERQFFKNFCDLLFEAIKTFSISEKALRSRCIYTTPEVTKKLHREGLSLMGISSHLANWEWLGLALGFEFDHTTFVIYKPLSSAYLNQLMMRSRERFGTKLVPIKKLREIFQMNHGNPIAIGLLSDQAPHDYAKAFEVEFLGRKTWVTPGAGVLTAQRGMTPVWGWMKRVGRSRYEWGVEVLEPVPPSTGWSADELQQIDRIAAAHGLHPSQAAYALSLTQLFTRKLEEKIKMAPQDWLWSHRRWKLR